MGMNPPPIERLVAGWGWWRDPMMATLVWYRELFGWGGDVPPEVRFQAPQLFNRGYHPKLAVRVVMEGFGDVALRLRPEDWGVRSIGVDYERSHSQGRENRGRR